ncbi:MAG TPA: methyltransferase domain-containing protein [Terriglobia bacterium]|nr:methyltransferase domain-containing protein [Terriglobia bacterium]
MNAKEMMRRKHNAFMPAIKYTKEFYQNNWEGSLRSAQEIIPIVLELVQPRRVVELGCGVGAWLSVLKSYGVEYVLGVDGDYVNREQLLIPKEQFIPFDLEKPFRIEKDFDLAIALEVAEHLPRNCSEIFVSSLVQLAPVVLFSAAVPFQGGTHHINEQWPDFWANIFSEHNFVPIDCIRKRVWQNERVEWWYAQNTLIYAKRELVEENVAFTKAFKGTCISQLRVIHPLRYLAAVDPERIPLRRILPFVQKVVLSSLKRRAKGSFNLLGH